MVQYAFVSLVLCKAKGPDELLGSEFFAPFPQLVGDLQCKILGVCLHSWKPALANTIPPFIMSQ